MLRQYVPLLRVGDRGVHTCRMDSDDVLEGTRELKEGERERERMFLLHNRTDE